MVTFERHLSNIIAGWAPANSSTLDVRPLLVAGVNSAGSLVPIASSSGTLTVDTELTLAADNVTIASTISVTLPTTSTINIVPTGTQDVRLAIIGASLTGTIPISFVSTSTLGASITALPGVTSTVNIGTTGTIGLSGHTTSTIPISFATTSTLGASITALPGATSTVTVGNISGSITAPFTGGVNTSTFPVSFLSTSTLGASITALPGATSSITFSNTSGTINFIITSSLNSRPVSVANAPGDNASNANVGSFVNQTGATSIGGNPAMVALAAFDGTAWDRIRTTDAILGGTITIGLLAVGALNPLNISANTTSTVVNVGTSASTIFAVNASRNYAAVTNVFGGTIYIRHGLLPTTTNFDAFLTTTPPRDRFEWRTMDNLWRGNIQAISSAATSSVALIEW